MSDPTETPETTHIAPIAINTTSQPKTERAAASPPPPRSKQGGPWGLIGLLLLLAGVLVDLALRTVDKEQLYHCHGQEERSDEGSGASVHHVPLNIELRIDDDELSLKSYPHIEHNAFDNEGPIQFKASRGQARMEGTFVRSSGELRYEESRPKPINKQAPFEHTQGTFQCQLK